MFENSNISKNFNSKILLFGEYSIIKNSWALAMPYDVFSGSLSFFRTGSEKSLRIDTELKAFAQYMNKLKKELDVEFDVTSFKFDVGQGLAFNSTIPQGYGLGSSGALCAALFDRYGKIDDSNRKNISLLKKIFSKMESHFHGSSSGVDPLISYLNASLLLKGKDDIGFVNLPKYQEGKGAIFLLNTGRARRTEPLVNLFLEKCTNEEFMQLCSEILIPVTNKCIELFLKQKINDLYDQFLQLSLFQYTHFKQMIPTLFQEQWLAGLNEHKYYLKLCGAGGGGFILGITKDFAKVSELFANDEIKSVVRF